MGIIQKGQVEYDDELHVRHELIRIGVYILAIVGVIFLVHTFVGSRSEVVGHSMEDTLQDGESVWLDKWTYRFQAPERYDIVVFPVAETGTYFIKRILALPGETIYIDEQGAIYVGTEEELYLNEDGTVHNEAQQLMESYGSETIQAEMRGIAAEPVTLGEDEYFVMGDNRNNSKDSRSEEIGPISADQIQGKAVFRLWPFSRVGVLE